MIIHVTENLISECADRLFCEEQVDYDYYCTANRTKITASNGEKADAFTFCPKTCRVC